MSKPKSHPRCPRCGLRQMDIKKHLAWHERRAGKAQSLRQRVMDQLKAKGLKPAPATVERIIAESARAINLAEVKDARCVTIDGPAHVPGLT